MEFYCYCCCRCVWKCIILGFTLSNLDRIRDELFVVITYCDNLFCFIIFGEVCIQILSLIVTEVTLSVLKGQSHMTLSQS